MSKYRISRTKKFKKQYKILEKRNYNMQLLDEIIVLLAKGETLPEKYDDHPLKGTLAGYRDCHIKDDWVLIYRIIGNVLILLLFETGTHTDLFE